MVSSLQQGIDAAKASRINEALDFLKDAIIEEPNNAEVWVWIAAIIDDLDKQESFLERALEIDPNNIPAQHGLAYLQKRKRDHAKFQNDHLSDHTKPISPFPTSQRPQRTAHNTDWAKLTANDLDRIAQHQPNQTKPKNTPGSPSNKLSPLEITLLGVVVIVFCFIGLLASSALFDFELPLKFLKQDRPRLETEPPYPGVFLHENGVFFDIQQHQGIPVHEIGIPTSSERDPVIVFANSDARIDQLNLIYETGEYIPFQDYQGRGNSDLLQPEGDLQPGLYCFQQIVEAQERSDPFYWCFRMISPTP
jgi:tetratricopeptide (TPR) repeat protein